jgi:heme exporter protein A
MLAVSQITLERHFKPVFEPLDFELSRGALLVITGANGCGKTTLIRLLAGVLTPSSGSIQSHAKGTAYVGHALALKDDLSVEENLRFVSSFQGLGVSSVEEVIFRVGLRRVAGQIARTLSAGQRKRCSLARLMLIPAELWLLDEPYSSLDDEGMALLDSMLLAHSARGGSCVLATHGPHRPPVANMSDIRLAPGVARA